MASNPTVVDFVIAENPTRFPAAHLLPEGMKRLKKYGLTQVWSWRREILNETVDSSPDAVIRSELDRLKKSNTEFFTYLGDVQHWWPILHSSMSEPLLDRVDAYTDDTEVNVDWNYLLIRKANPTQIDDLISISAQMVARCYGLTEAVRRCQEIMLDLPDSDNLAKLRKDVGALEEVKLALLVDLVTSDARPRVYGSFAFETYSEIRRVWNMEEIEVSSQRSLDACESLLAQIRQAGQAKRERWRADTLLALTIISSVSAVFSFIGYVHDSGNASDFVKIGVPAIIALGAATIFGVLRRISSD